MTAPRALVVGESVLDIVDRDGACSRHPGGSPANTAVGLARLGIRTALLTEIAQDEAGAVLRDHLSRAGVELLAVAEPERTSAARAHIGSAGQVRYDFDISWTLRAGDARRAIADAQRFDHLHVGSVAAYLEPGSAAVADLVDHAEARTTVSFDPNVRPALVGDRDRAVQLTEHLARGADVIKASDEDIAWLYPGEDATEIAHRWLQHRPMMVVITRGAAGATACLPGRVEQVPIVPGPVVDTVGAGDAFTAALVDGLLRGRLIGAEGEGSSPRWPLLREVLSRAARASALTVGRSGAQPPTASELTAARDSV